MGLRGVAGTPNLGRKDWARLNALCPYFTMFPLEFPLQHLTMALPGEWVLDPFCGRGTTNYAARLKGLPTVGVDANPVAVAIANAKLVTVTPEEVVAEAAAILAGPPATQLPRGTFWELAYHPDTLAQVCQLREALMVRCDTPARVMLRALVLGVLHGPLRVGAPSYLSNQMPRTYATKPEPAMRYWKRHRLTPPRVDVLDVIARRTHHVLSAVPEPVPGTIVHGDSRQPGTIPNVPGGYAWIVTSPPYFGMRSYKPDQWLRLWFLGGPDDVTYDYSQQVRHRQAEYVDDLARVWKNVATVSRARARLVVRFGCLPSTAVDPLDVLERSFGQSGAGWRILQVKDAGKPPRGRRQATQFGDPRGPVTEIDVIAELTT